LRIDRILREFPGVLSKIRKSGLTFAPEAGTARLRAHIKKGIDIAQLYPAVDAAYAAGWKKIKLYFMVGLPSESYEDIDGIIETVQAITGTNRRIGINISVSSFIPKPHTPFERGRMEETGELKKRFYYIKDRIRSRRVKMSFHDPELSALEGVFSRGDRAIGAVIMRAFEKGCRFDSWREHLKLDAWREAFAEEGVDPGRYIYVEKGAADELPWRFISYI